jgi:hypothetical protein
VSNFPVEAPKPQYMSIIWLANSNLFCLLKLFAGCVASKSLRPFAMSVFKLPTVVYFRNVSPAVGEIPVQIKKKYKRDSQHNKLWKLR